MFILYTFDTIYALFVPINTVSFRNPFFLKLSLPVISTNQRRAETSVTVSCIPFSSKFSACSWATVFFHVTLSATIRQLQYNRSQVINASFWKLVLHKIIYDAVLSRYVIHCIHQYLFAEHVLFRKQSPALFDAWITRSIHTILLEPAFYWRYLSSGGRPHVYMWWTL